MEDISQSCNDLAAMRGGKVIYRGSPQDLIAQARGSVWMITTQAERPNGGLTIVSTLQMANGVQYRVLGDPDGRYDASPVEPSLEDGYMWLMAQANDQLAALAAGSPKRETA